MALLKRSKTAENLKYAFAGKLQANRRYRHFAQKAEVEGYNDVAAVFRSPADGETGHAHGDPDYPAAWAIRPPPWRWAKSAATRSPP
jgi:hypothetical protein